MAKIGRPRSNAYEEFGFTLTKMNNKFVAICSICNRTLQNTAFGRLRGHRNICRRPSEDNEPLCSMFVPDDTIWKPIENKCLSPDAGSETSAYSFKCSPSMMLEDSGIIADDVLKIEIAGSNFSPFYNPEQVKNKKSETNLKKVAVLELIKQNKHILFENTLADKTAVWMKVLKKAQSLGLASEDKPWTFARDSLYGAWKNRALSKKECLDSNGWIDKLDIVDFTIFQILGTKPKTSSREDDQHYEKTNSSDKTEVNIRKRNVISTPTPEEKCENKMKKLRFEVLKLEIYKQKLQALQLERELKLPPSKSTVIFFPELQKTPTNDTNETGQEINADSPIKKEVGDSD